MSYVPCESSRVARQLAPARAGLVVLGGLLAFVLGARPAAAEEGLVNVHLSLGAGVLANDAAAEGIRSVGLDLNLKVDVPVHRWVAPQIGYGLIYLPGSGSAESGVHMVMFGARVRVLNDEKGYLANLWPRSPRGNPWGNLWVELSLGYAHAPTVSGVSHWFALELGVGYEFSLAGPLQIGPYLSYRQIFVKKELPAFVCIGVSISFGYPKKIPRVEGADVRPRPQPRPNIVGRQGDRDGDYVGDGIDKCPSTPPGAKVDENGCEYIRGKMMFPGLRFKPGTTTLVPGAIFALRRMAEIIKAQSGVKVEIGGHTDEPGSVEDNLKLSLSQAQVVRDKMVEMGVPSARLFVRGYGVSTPLKRSETPEGKQANRRIEFRFTIGQPKAD
jgi:outer membrane protein OmpA-like peptidoglycan-associated protein